MRLDVVRDSGPKRLEELHRLFDAVQKRTHHAPLGEHKFLDLVHGGPDCFRGIVAREGDEVVGYGHLSRHGDNRWELELVADMPALRTTLAHEAIDLLKQEGGGHVHLWVFHPTDEDDSLATELGLHKGRDLLHMRVALPLEKTQGLPEGFVLRHFVPGRDETAWLDVNNRAFAKHPEQGSWDAKTLTRRMGESWFDPEGFLLAEDADGVAGFCWTKLNEECGEIYVIGVDPRAQASGLGKALVVAGLDYISGHRDHGCLYVDAAQTNAVELYRKLGFQEDHRDRAYVGDI